MQVRLNLWLVLDELSDNLKEEWFRKSSKHFQNEWLNLVIKKRVHPYEYMDNIDKIQENILQDIRYYSRLNKYRIKN